PYSKPDFLCLVDPPLIPNLLLYVGPNYRKEYLLYNNIVYNDWIVLIKNRIPKVIYKQYSIILEHPINSLLTKKGTVNYIQVGQGKEGLGISRFLKIKSTIPIKIPFLQEY
ncbi:hypothetical protein N7509_003039, partial [Penicillium cosmopolitanum]